MLSEIESVDWDALPGHPDWYEPDRVPAGLRALDGARNLVQAADAGSLLGCGGIVHDHSGAVFPAAAVAAPFLLDIAQQGHPTARGAALGLLDEALSFVPQAGYTRVAGPAGQAHPICCAVAHHLRSRTDFLVGQGAMGRSLLADAAEHWRFEVRESVVDGDDTAAFGILAGRIAGGVARGAELHVADAVVTVDEVVLEYPPVEGSPEACLRLVGRRPYRLPQGATLLPGACGPANP